MDMIIDGMMIKFVLYRVLFEKLIALISFALSRYKW